MSDQSPSPPFGPEVVPDRRRSDRQIQQVADRMAQKEHLQQVAAEIRVTHAAIDRLTDTLIPEIDQRQRKVGVGVIAVALLTTALICLAIFNAIAITSTRNLGRDMHDCIDPDGQCFRDNERRAQERNRDAIAVVVQDAQIRDRQQNVLLCDLYSRNGGNPVQIPVCAELLQGN